ncbi:MAG: tRNA lysidine(34) synthetase TilS [Paracoccus sp. (in: a-proteobacteria)]|nr:tRNA lysidine(34) synthetase TilS [Paracoccus sp. (in: a-proteobacteria)]
MTKLDARIRLAFDRLAGDLPALGLAVSGGGDSVAMLHLAAQWAGGRRIMVATVDHGLRPESAAEAAEVGRAAQALGLPHVVLHWARESTTGNVMAQARDARLRLLSEWAQRNDLPAIALGHTADDQAETLLMRLARGAGIDGLSGMAPCRDALGMRWLRPLLDIHRHELRDWLIDRSITWIDDPSNDNFDFERVRTRQAIAALGLDGAALARSASHIAEARQALSHYAAQVARTAIADRGSLILDRGAYHDAPVELRRRLLVAGCRWITGAAYPPRRATLVHAMRAVDTGARVTLDGALVTPAATTLRLTREAAAAMRAEPVSTGVWDHRWKLPQLAPGLHVAALGHEALADLPWRRLGLMRDEAAASPAIWQGKRLIDAPILRPRAYADGTLADFRRPPLFAPQPIRGAADFHSLVKAH